MNWCVLLRTSDLQHCVQSFFYFAYFTEALCSCRSYRWSAFSIGSLYALQTYAYVIRLFQVFRKAVKQVADKSIQFGPPIFHFFFK